MKSRVHEIVVLPGDGIGVEVTTGAVAVLRKQAARRGFDLDIVEHPVGGRALQEQGDPLPRDVLQACLDRGVVLLGAVGDSRFDGNPPEMRPERGILQLRRELGLYANLRPVTTFDALLDASTLKREVVEGVDILVVRELTGGIYFGKPRSSGTRDGVRVALNTEIYHDFEIERIARTAFEAAGGRRGRVTSVDKSNVLESSQLWRNVVEEVATDYPDIAVDHMFVDNCAMQLIRDPRQFDVILTSNMFGDILSDEAAMLTGSLGMLPSASLGRSDGDLVLGLYEPVHGTAPDIAGRDRANPLAAILSAALLLRHSLSEEEAAGEIEQAVVETLEEGSRAADLVNPGESALGTLEMTDRILRRLS